MEQGWIGRAGRMDRAHHPTTRGFHIGFVCAIVLLATAIIGLTLGSAGLSNLSSKSDATWTAWSFRKKQDLIERAGSGRVVIVSGSNALFGISAAELTRLTGYEAINAATHAGLPFDLFDEELLRKLRPGDIAILALESGIYSRPDPPKSLGVHVAHQIGLSYFLNLSLTQKIDYLRLLEPGFVIAQYRQALSDARARKIFAAISRFGYFTLGIDGRGDVDLTTAVPNPRKVVRGARSLQDVKISSEGSDQKGDVICRSVRALVARGVRVIGTPDNVYIEAEAGIRERQGVLARAGALYEACGGKWVAPVGEGLQPLDRMYDTPFHLNLRGRRLRTLELARALCEKALACPPGAFDKED